MENIPITNIDIEHYKKQNTFDFNRNGYLKMVNLMFQFLRFVKIFRAFYMLNRQFLILEHLV